MWSNPLKQVLPYMLLSNQTEGNIKRTSSYTKDLNQLKSSMGSSYLQWCK